MPDLVLIFALILTGIIPAFADSPVIPEWFDVVYQYWKNGQITEAEFADSISYLEEIGIMNLSDAEVEPIADFLVTESIIRQSSLGHSEFSDCSAGWYITGYFTPFESDYSGKFVTINVDNISYKFREDFVEEVKIEGWGKTISGEYLGWYGESFHLGDHPLDSFGNRMEIGTIAIDQTMIDANSNVTIPTLPEPWNGFVFVGADIGPAIIGKHIDVYTGDGKKAHDETYRITGHDNVVCLEAR